MTGPRNTGVQERQLLQAPAPSQTPCQDLTHDKTL